MKTKISKLLIALLVVTVGTVYASNQLNVNDTKNYKQMTTAELQIQVEKLSNQGNLPFEMGLELMNRWTETKKEIN